MEVFSIFATLSLQDLLSGPLGRIRQAMHATGADAQTLSGKFGNLALAMGPIALAGGAVMAALGKCVSTAAGFEDQMAKVGAISRANSGDLAALEARARELGATTQFTASEVAQAEQYLAMAGFSVQENLAALPGVLNLAAATSTDLGRAADISSDIMGAFGLQASEMTRVADTLALTCAQANTDMELLGDTMKYVAPVAKKAGLSLEETAAMAGLLGDVGIKGSQAGTTMKAMLNKMAAPTSEATALLKKLGVTTKDAAGNLRSPIQVLGELTGKLKNLGSADQIEAMKKIVGEEAMAGFSELLNQADGSGKLLTKIENLLKGGGTAAEMAARQNDSLAGDMRSLGSAFESVQITIGKLFIPVLRKGASAITTILRLFDKFSQSKFGSTVIKIAGAIATAVVAITAFSAAMWAVGKVAPMISSVFTGIKAAMLGLGAPIWAIVAAVGIFYVAWKNNFGGIATVVARWAKNISLVFQGVCAVFETLKGTSGEIRGELAKEIKANGLIGVVTTIGKYIFRIREFIAGIWDGLNFDAVINAFMPAVRKIRELFDTVGNAIAKLFGGEVKTAASEARSLGKIIGSALTWTLQGLATAISVVVNAIDSIISAIRWLCAIFTGDFSTALEMGRRIWDNFCDSLLEIANFLGIGDWIREAWAGVTDFFTNLNFADAVKSAWASVTDFLSGINPLELIRQAFAGLSEFFASLNLVDGIRMAWDAVVQFFASLNLFESGARLIQTLKDGILSMAGSLIDGVKGVFSSIRNLLPFSDAKEGPLSELTLSGSRIMTTLGAGVNQGKDALKESVQGALGEVNGELNNWNAEINPLEMQNPELPQNPAVEGIKPPLPEAAAMSVKLEEVAGVPAPEMAVPDIPAIPQPEPIEVRLGGVPEIAVPEPAPLAMPETPKPAPVEFALGDIPQIPQMEPVAINAGPMPDLQIPSPEPLTMQAGQIPPVSVPELAAPAMPEIPQPAPVEISMGEIPEIPGLQITAPKMPEIPTPAIQKPEMPKLEIGIAATPDMQAPEVPQPGVPEVAIPPAPMGFSRERAMTSETTASGERANQNITINIQNITLPDVKDNESFVSSLKKAFQGEIGQLEGATA